MDGSATIRIYSLNILTSSIKFSNNVFPSDYRFQKFASCKRIADQHVASAVEAHTYVDFQNQQSPEKASAWTGYAQETASGKCERYRGGSLNFVE